MNAFDLPNYGPGCGLARAIDERDPNRPRSPDDWVRIAPGAPRPITGSEAIVRDVDGKHYVGRLISEPFDPFVELALLGSSETLWLERARVADSCAMPWHRWSERRAVAERQARGEPARVISEREAAIATERARKAAAAQAERDKPRTRRTREQVEADERAQVARAMQIETERARKAAVAQAERDKSRTRRTREQVEAERAQVARAMQQAAAATGAKPVRLERRHTVRCMAIDLGVPADFVLEAYVMHLKETGEGPDAEELFLACARLELLKGRALAQGGLE